MGKEGGLGGILGRKGEVGKELRTWRNYGQGEGTWRNPGQGEVRCLTWRHPEQGREDLEESWSRKGKGGRFEGILAQERQRREVWRQPGPERAREGSFWLAGLEVDCLQPRGRLRT